MITKIILDHDKALPILEILFPHLIVNRKRRTIIANDFASINGWIFDGANSEIRQWGIGSELCCWHCTRNIINHAPVGVPIREEKGLYYVYGCFCSFSCASTWNKDTKYEISDRHTRDLLLRSLFAASETDEKEIYDAPPKEILLKYGGFATDDIYESCLTHFKVTYVPTNLVSVVPSMKLLGKISAERAPKESKYKLFRREIE